MAEILHQLIGSLSHCLQGFIYPQVVIAGFLSHQQYHLPSLPKNTVGDHLMLEILLGVVSPLSAWDLNLVQEPGQPTLAASMMPKKTKLQTPHISIDA